MGISCVHNLKSCKKVSDIYGNCSSCYPNYISNLGSCQACPYTGCVLSSSSVVSNICTCTQCLSGYYLTGVTCTPCSTVNCAICAGDVCSACVQGYYFNGGVCALATVGNCLQAKSGSATLCAICNTGYYKGTDELCYACPGNCL